MMTHLSFSRLAAAALLGAFALTACAVDGQDPVDEQSAGEEIASKSDALKNNGGGPRTGFSCDRSEGTCTCDKGIEGDCDDMRKNCTGGLPGLDSCIDGWLTTHCSCTYGRAAVYRPGGVFLPPVGGGVFTASP